MLEHAACGRAVRALFAAHRRRAVADPSERPRHLFKAFSRLYDQIAVHRTLLEALDAHVFAPYDVRSQGLFERRADLLKQRPARGSRGAPSGHVHAVEGGLLQELVPR